VELTPTRIEQLMQLQKLLQINFRDLQLLNKALTHKSFANEHRKHKVLHNERLEFFGDAVLKLVVSEFMMTHYPEHNEGDMTKLRATAVSDANLAQLARNLDLGQYLLLSANEAKTGGAKRKSNLANAMEALFGALYLDSGYALTSRLILSLLQSDLEGTVVNRVNKDYKSELQEHVQQDGLKLPEYKILKEEGPDHQKVFVVQAKISKGLRKFKAEGSGHTKKEAEQAAAQALLKKLK
jgi:ribonuclease-3